jgi:hypothetical protein
MPAALLAASSLPYCVVSSDQNVTTVAPMGELALLERSDRKKEGKNEGERGRSGQGVGRGS